MNEVYHAVRLGKKLDPAWYDWQDDLGLTVLHYAILLKKEELDTDLLDKREWFSQTSMIDNRGNGLYRIGKTDGVIKLRPDLTKNLRAACYIAAEPKGHETSVVAERAPA